MNGYLLNGKQILQVSVFGIDEFSNDFVSHSSGSFFGRFVGIETRQRIEKLVSGFVSFFLFGSLLCSKSVFSLFVRARFASIFGLTSTIDGLD
jgi:hypothetical protein